MYTCRIFIDSGFNAVNIPDSPALLNAVSFIDLPSLDILQDGFLSEVRVRTSWDPIKEADYCKVGDWYYFVTGIEMSSIDVATLALAPDFLTTAGGIAGISFLDGVTRRTHVDDDTYGKYGQDDPYLAPSEPLIMDYAEIEVAGRAGYQLAESTIDLGLMGAVAGAEVYIDPTTGDETTGEAPETVTVPKAYPKGGKGTEYSGEGMYTGADLGSALYPVNTGNSDAQNLIKDGIQACRALGIESAITNVVEIPAEYVDITYETEQVQPYGTAAPYKDSVYTFTNAAGNQETRHTGKPVYNQTKSWRVVKTIEGQVIENSTTFQYEYAQVKNKRALYGTHNRVGILTNAGNRYEAKPEDVYGSGETVIKVKSFGDPHTTGCPYHAFKYQNGRTSSTLLWTSAVKGLQWKKLPLIFNGQSGGALQRQEFENSRALSTLQHNVSLGAIDRLILRGGRALGLETGDTTELLAGAYGGVGSLAGIMGTGLAAGNAALGAAGITAAGAAVAAPAALGALALGAGAIGGGLMRFNRLAKAEQAYAMEKRNELQSFLTSQAVVAPSIHIAYDNEALRDFNGDILYCYRYRYTTNDLARIDKILTMYGYAVTLPVEESLFTSRQYFNYVEASVTVRGRNRSIPRWLSDGISAQISNGVRVWHVLPSPAYYNDNPIVSTP